MKHFTRLFTLVLGLLVAATVAEAQIAKTITYQGVLKDASGARITGTVALELNIYLSSGGGSLYTDTHASISVDNGLFTVVIGGSGGSGGAIPLDFYAPYDLNACAVQGDAAIDNIFGESGDVGIGTLTPDNTLHIHKGTAGAVTASSIAPLVVESNDHAYINILSPGGLETGIYFGDDSDNNVGQLFYAHGDNSMRFFTDNVERMRIKNDGSVGIGRTPTTNKLEVEGDASKTTAGDWLANSDRRIKTDIQDIENAMDTISLLHPVKFKYNDAYMAEHPSVQGPLLLQLRGSGVPGGVSREREGGRRRHPDDGRPCSQHCRDQGDPGIDQPEQSA